MVDWSVLVAKISKINSVTEILVIIVMIWIESKYGINISKQNNREQRQKTNSS